MFPIFKDDVHSVLGIGSAHNKARGPQMQNCLNFASFELLFDWFIPIYKHNKPDK